MSDEPELLTAKQYEELKAELAELEGRRPEIVQAIKVAREFGDISENFAYHDAKNEQGLLEARISVLRHRVDNSQIVELRATDVVGVGTQVEIEDPTGKTLSVEISNLTKPGAVSPTAPLGAALMGARAGDEVEVAAPRGSWTAKIVSISPA
jgi:transcription elongation factor GreA